MQKFKLILCFLVFIFFQPSFATTINHYKLKNGLNIFVKVDKRAPVVVSQIWYKVGSIYEPDTINGISHVLEHMMFEGSEHYPDDAFSKIIAANGGEINAETSNDYTHYYEILAANKLALSFKLEADRMQHLTLSDSAFQKEIKVVQEERRMRTDTNPQAITLERFMAAAYVSSPYHQPVVGWMSNLVQMNISEVRHWYQQWYTPNNAIVVVVGDVDPAKVYLLAKKYFAAIPSRTIPTVNFNREIPGLGTKTIIVNVPAKLPWIILGYNVPSIKSAKQTSQPYALELAADILDNGASTRIPKNLIRGTEIASDAGSSYDPFARLSTLFMLYGTPSAKHSVKQLQEALLNQINQLKNQPVNAEELNRAKIQLLAQQTYDEDSIDDQAELIGSLEAIGLSWQIGENFINEINKITPAQIQAVAKQFLNSKNLTIAYLKPIKINMPDMPQTNTNPITTGAGNVR